MAGAVALTGFFLTGRIGQAGVSTYAEFSNCGQGLRKNGDVKLRGVLVGMIGGIEREPGGNCKVKLDLFPSDIDMIPANVEAQVRAKTVFGEKWVELIYPESPAQDRFAKGDVIPTERTIDPLEVETILNIGLPLLEAIDPEMLSGALNALAEGFVGHEEAAIRGIRSGIQALEPLNSDKALVREGIRQLAESGEVLDDVDEDLLAALDNLDEVNLFTSRNAALLAENLQKTPILLNELSLLFETRLTDLTKLVNSGATVISVVAAKTGDLDRLLNALPRFNAAWNRNLNAVCRYRQPTSEPGKATGDVVPGRCWRVHNLISESRGAYEEGEVPRVDETERATLTDLGVEDPGPLDLLLYAPALLRAGGAL